MPDWEPIHRASELQHGVVSRRQIIAAGGSKDAAYRARPTGLLVPHHRGVYRTGGAPRTWLQDLKAATLAGGDGAVVSHRAAAALWGLPHHERGPVELTIPFGRSYTVDGVVAHRSRRMAPVDVTAVFGIPVTAPPLTLIHLAAVTPAEQLQDCIDEVIRSGLASAARIRWRFRELGGRGVVGSTLFRELLDEYMPGSRVPASVFERRLLRVCRAAHVDEPALNYRIKVFGQTVEVDAAWPDRLVCVEADSRRFHDTVRHAERDAERRALLAAHGWRIVPVRWWRLKLYPDLVVRDIQAALAFTPRHHGSVRV